mgnify:CR=1 FL=1
MSLFSPPVNIQTEVFARVPDRLRRPGQRPAWANANAPGRDIDCFLEGPAFDREGNLYVVNIPFGEIFRISLAGEFDVVAQYDGWPNGLKVHKDGSLYVADYKNGIMRVDPISGAVETVIDHRWSEGFHGCNDLHFAANGDIYFTDQGQSGVHEATGRVYRYTTGGRLERLIANGPSPNGLVLNPQESILYIGMTRGNAAWRVPLLPDGTTTKVGIYIQLSGGHGGPDLKQIKRWRAKPEFMSFLEDTRLLHRCIRLVEGFPTRPRSSSADNIQLVVAPADQGWGGVWGQQGGVGVGVLLLRWRSSVVPRGTRRPLAGVCWSGPTPGSIRSSPAPPVGACGLRQPSPQRAAVPRAAAATASWCGDRCCCRYGRYYRR